MTTNNIKEEIQRIIESPLRSQFSTSDIRIGAWSSTMLFEKVNDIAELFLSSLDKYANAKLEEAVEMIKKMIPAKTSEYNHHSYNDGKRDLAEAIINNLKTK